MPKGKTQVNADRHLEKMVREDIIRYQAELEKAIVNVAARYQVTAARGIMTRFYNDYDPFHYRRTWNLRFKSTIKPYKDFKKKQGGVIISSEGMDDYYVRGKKNINNPRPAQLIWYSMWIQGYHGFDGKIQYRDGVPQNGRTPYEQLLIVRDKMLPQIKKEAISVAQNRKRAGRSVYKILHF